MAAPMPEELAPSGGLVRADDGDEDDPLENIRHGHIPIEEKLARQVDRIAYLRSAGYPWGEAVLHLRDMVVGLEDEEFYDGIPDSERSKIQVGELGLAETREAYADYGWDTFSVRAYEATNGEYVLDPSPSDLSQAYRIIQRLLARKGLVYKRKKRTRFAPYGEADQAATNGGAKEGESDA